MFKKVLVFPDYYVRCLLVFIVFSILIANTLRAQDINHSRRRVNTVPRFELSEIVVTAFKIKEPILSIPRNITVITSEDIERASSNNVVDLLARESGITLKSFFGHDKQAGIDIRGMGATSSSNVIVMADGVRLNPPDMAGPDLSSIPLDQIERIEILRGTGAVIYGEGSVGGVINIITKKGQIEPETRIYSSYGSYDTSDIRTSFHGEIYSFLISANANYYDTEGFRDNGDLDKTDVSLFTGYDIGDHIYLTLRTSIHEDTYGLPGGVSKVDMDSEDSRKATYESLEDSGETTDKRFIGKTEIDFGNLGSLAVQRGYRFRKNSYIMGFSDTMSKEEQTNYIDEDSRNFSLNYDITFELSGLEHIFQCGLEHYETEYISERLSMDERINNKVRNLGVFMANEWVLTDNLMIRLGYRHNRYKGHYRIDEHRTYDKVERWVIEELISHIWSNNAYEIGTTYSPHNNTRLFLSIASSFRVPNMDELAWKDEDLHPQKGEHLEIGVRQRIKEFMELTFALFQIEIIDEIYYIVDPNGNELKNRNYDETTLRKGLEIDMKLYPTENLYLWCNYSYIDARLKERDIYIPLVPKHKANIGLELQLPHNFLFSLTGSFIGPGFDGNDTENGSFDKLGGHEVFDGKLTYEYKGLRLFAGVNNILDENYSTIAYGEEYYPMPGRNFYGGVEWKF